MIISREGEGREISIHKPMGSVELLIIFERSKIVLLVKGSLLCPLFVLADSRLVLH